MGGSSLHVVRGEWVMLWMATILLLLSMAGKVQSRRVDEQFCWGVSYWLFITAEHHKYGYFVCIRVW